MTDFNAPSDRDVTRAIRSWLHEDRHEDVSRVAGAVLDQVDTTRQRRATWWPARRTPAMNKIIGFGIAAAAVAAISVVGINLLPRAESGPSASLPSPLPTVPATASPQPTATLGATPSPTGAFGGTIQYRMDGAAATTEVDAIATGASVSGTAITTIPRGTHTVRLACTARDGDTWVLAGTTEQSTVPGEPVGAWSAVFVKDGSPQQIGIWLSGDAPAGSDCDGFLAAHALADIGPENFQPVESGALVPPPSPTGAFGGTVQYQMDGRPATTEVDAIATGASVSGTAITTIPRGTHTVRLACTARDGDTWVLAGTTEQSTVPGEPVGAWSAVFVKDGSPQQIGIWLSGDAPAGSDCDGFLAAHALADIGPENFQPVESGALVPPPEPEPAP